MERPAPSQSCHPPPEGAQVAREDVEEVLAAEKDENC